MDATGGLSQGGLPVARQADKKENRFTNREKKNCTQLIYLDVFM